MISIAIVEDEEMFKKYLYYTSCLISLTLLSVEKT